MESHCNCWKRYVDWDERPLRFDKFAAEDPANGISTLWSPADPKPRNSINHGKFVALGGVLEHDFDMFDRVITRHNIDAPDHGA